MEEDSGTGRGAKRKRNEIFNQTFLESRAGALSLTNQIPFPVKLYQMLGDLEETGNDHIASWSSDGTCIRVHDPTTFVHSILASYFRQTKYKSFQKQLYLYGFSRIVDGRHRGFYFHPEFQRSNKSRCGEIMPMKRKGKKGQDEQSSTGETTDEARQATTQDNVVMKTSSHKNSAEESPKETAQHTSGDSSSDVPTTRSGFVMPLPEQLPFPLHMRLQINDALQQRNILGSHLSTAEVSSMSDLPAIASMSSSPGTIQSNVATGTSFGHPPLDLVNAPYPLATTEPPWSGQHLHTLQGQHQMNASILEALARHSNQDPMRSPNMLSLLPPGSSSAATTPGMSTSNYLSMILQHMPRSGLIDPAFVSRPTTDTFSFGGLSTQVAGLFSVGNAFALGVPGADISRSIDTVAEQTSSRRASLLDQEVDRPSSSQEYPHGPEAESLAAVQNKETANSEGSSSENLTKALQSTLTDPEGEKYATAEMAPSSSISDDQRVEGAPHGGSSGENSIDSTVFDALS